MRKETLKCESFLVRFSDIELKEGIYADYELSSKLLSVKNENLLRLLEEYNNIKTDIKRREASRTEIENVVRHIKSYGRFYVEAISEFQGCPMCGNENISLEVLTEHLKSDSLIEGGELPLLEKKYIEAEGKIEELRNEIKALEIKANDLTMINTAHDFIVEHWHIKEGVQNANKLDVVHEYIKKCKAFNVEFNMRKQEIGAIEEYLAKNSPQHLRQYLDFDSLMLLVADFEKRMGILTDTNASLDNRAKRLLKSIQQKQLQWNVEIPIYENKIKELKKSYEIIVEKAASYKQKISEMEKQIHATNERMSEMSKLDDFFQKAYMYVDDDMSEIDRQELLYKCDALVDMTENFVQQQQLELQQTNLHKNINELTAKIERVDIALEILDKLKSSDLYAKDFIRVNINRISDVFRSLHMPKEFDRLELTNDEIVGIRDNRSILLKNMSTGQKTSVVLSIFLTLNLALDTIPNLILIDEPVSNIDDMNILSLLDFLREIVICYDRQIFFTTANDNVRRLFRRKFSFLERDMKEFNFERSDSMKTTITTKKYDQEKMLEECPVSFVD